MLSLKDYSGDELNEIINMAITIKKNPAKYEKALKNKTLIMLFQKTSTRTRLSFEIGMTQLGGHAVYLDWRTTQFLIADFIDEIRATMRFGDILMYRPLKHESLVKAADVATIPIINALCEKYHPCQALGDMLTIKEKFGKLKGLTLVYTGIANNVSNSLVDAGTKLGMKVILAVPETDPESVDEELNDQAKKTGLYEITKDLKGAVKNADVLYTDTWINMEFFDKDGKVVDKFRHEFERRKTVFAPYQVNAKLLKETGSNAKIMHDMACHVPYEITRDAIDHPNSIIFDQAENRLHVQKAIMLYLLGKKP
jgi:ornithine carbamoyltransferase